jgi:hypothetical protein
MSTEPRRREHGFHKSARRAGSALILGALVTGLSAAGSFALGSGTMNVHSGSTLVATGSVSNVTRGWSSLAGSNYHSAIGFAHDRSNDGRRVYTELRGDRFESYLLPRPGGKYITQTRWVNDGSARVYAESGSKTEGLGIRGKASNMERWRNPINVCVDISLAPDNCTSKTL